MRRTALATALLVPLIASACGDSIPTASSATAPEAASFDFTNGPSDLPNVLRFADQNVFLFGDPESDLVVSAGFPCDPRECILCCNGSEPAATMSFQRAGLQHEAVKTLVRAREIKIHVWNRSDFLTGGGVCATIPFAQGTGQVRYTDNNYFGNPDAPGANSFGLTIEGTVQDGLGNSYRVSGTIRQLIRPDGSFELIQRHITLHPVGAP